ncbi:FAD-dependent monooxygenase [Nocardiopsis aegyptia]|uniref:2-polyprenyl-6-methoxyphenol hydroxylase-like FAD-dependent oxidoreductase n=1 Tax=Nocardiopsis aegyptia TaxID=220378 RepID=A0A7Z0EPG9_9ACTN|nr:FAD-dependent monooxygenase [Nocardiopsis aegyptia]NYJ35679.1 2-polyprenyl-6-methoxyphenol hydroxylase-like FAD-dependent oxidoreductase [Nocardiopsis aegyptia]
MSTDNDVLIVGAGPTGLVLAIELARRGVVPRVIDAGPADVRESRAVAVVARSLEMLDDLGVAEAAVARGIPLRTVSFHQGASPLADIDLSALDSPFPMDLCLPQWQTAGLLRARAEELGVTIEWGTRLAAQATDGDAVTAEIVHGDGRVEQWTTRWLVGCDGAHSTVRRTSGFGWETDDLRRGFIVGDVAADWDLSRDRFHAFFGTGGVLAVFPMVGGLWRVLANTPDDRPPAVPALDDFAGYVDRRTPLEVRPHELAWSSSFVAREGLADRFRHGRVLLAGDAAHSHSPVGGQGMNTGMQDAYNLGWKLALVATGLADPSLLDSFEDERRPVARSVIEATSTATRVVTSRSLVVRRARRHGLRFLGRLNATQRRIATALGEHLVNYRDSALVSQAWEGSRAPAWSDGARTGPAGGEQAPDAYLETRAGATALRHVYRDPGHHLVLFAADVADPAVLRSWADAGRAAMGGYGRVHVVVRGHLPAEPVEGVVADLRGEAHNRYGVRRPSLYLVRPDKYVGYRADGIDTAPVRDYFRALAEVREAVREDPPSPGRTGRAAYWPDE